MSGLSVAGSVRQVLVDANIPNITYKIYRDIAPPYTEFPYITFFDFVSFTPKMTGDSQVIARNRQIQVSVWQLKADEDVDLIDSVISLLDNANLDANKNVFRCRVADVQRISNITDDSIQHAITLNITQAA